MLDAALVLFACLNSTGCNETSSQYFVYHPELKQMAKRKERQAKKIVGPYVIETFGPLLYVATGGTGTINLHKNWGLQINSKSGILSFRTDF